MLIRTAIYKKYANLTDYEDFVEATIKSLQSKFPQVRLRPFSEFKAFLDNLVPRLVHKYILKAGTMKNCSGVSPDFAEMGAQAGFPVLIQHVPGHQRNLVLTQEGPYVVDLTYIQFTCKYDLSDPDTRKEALENYKMLRKDPFKAIKVEPMDKSYFINTRLPHGEYDDLLRPDPLKSIEEYDPEDWEETFPEKFNRFK